MAEKKKPEHEGGKKSKLKLHAIRTEKADDGTFVHHHEYKDQHGMPVHTTGGTSSDLEDLQQHMQDHFGDGADAQAGADEGQAEEPEAGAAPQPAQAQGA